MRRVDSNTVHTEDSDYVHTSTSTRSTLYCLLRVLLCSTVLVYSGTRLSSTVLKYGVLLNYVHTSTHIVVYFLFFDILRRIIEYSSTKMFYGTVTEVEHFALFRHNIAKFTCTVHASCI
jgi:hypothetical protein